MTITFPAGTNVSQVSFKAIEMDGDWGSGGYVFLNVSPASLPGGNWNAGGTAVAGFHTYGSPTGSNTFIVPVSGMVTNIVLAVEDITYLSEIYIDDLIVQGLVAPTITTQPQGQVVPVSSNAAFAVSAVGTTPLYYQWQFNGTNLTENARISGSRTNVLAITNVTAQDAGSYSVVITNLVGSITSQLASLTVSKLLPSLAWPIPSPIPYGTALSSNQLNATANVPGSFAYNPTNGAVLNVGTNTLSVIFTPTDTVDYSSVTDSVSLVVVACVPPPSGIVSWWPGDGNASDIVGTNNGSISGSVLYANGRVNRAFAFDGTGGYVQSPTVTEGMSQGTVELWFNVNSWNWNSTPDGLYFWANTEYLPNSSQSFDGINLGTDSDYTSTGELLFGIYAGGWNWAHSGIVPQTNTWYHLAGTWGPSGISIYINGLLKATNPYSGPAPSYTVYNLIGRSSWSGSGINGLVDEVSVYNRALTSNEVAAIYSAGAGGKCKRATPLITWTNPAPIIYGTALSSNQLNATANVPGSFAYNPPSGTVLNAGTNTLSVIFTPTDTVHYSSVTDSVSLVVLACVPPPSGLVAWWQMEGSVTDIVSGIVPIATNALSFVPAEVGRGVSLGTGGYIDIPPSPLLESQRFTWETWARWDGPGPTEDSAGSVILENALNGTFGYALSARASDHRFVLTCGTIFSSAAVSSNIFTQGVFYHVAASYDGATFKLYVNGILEAQLAAAGTLNWGNFWSIGANPAFARNQGIPRTWNGVIDEVSIYNRALSSNEIVAIYSAGAGGKCRITNAPLPDLQVISVAMPAQAWTGRAFDVAWVVTNAGSTVATGSWVDRVYLSATNQLNTNQDQLLGEFPFLGHLNPGQVVQLIQTVTVNRTGITNGPYYISVFTDARNSVFEGPAETNNVGISISNINVQLTPLPDLVVASVDGPAIGIGGKPVGVSWIVCNQGGADTDIPLWFDHLYLSPTTNIASAIDYGQFENPSYLAPGDCYEQPATVTLPIGVGGPYYFIVKADSTGLLTEASKSNDIGTTILPISIQLVQPGFLHVASVQVAPAPPTVTWAGQQITCTYVVQNIGQSTIAGAWDDRITLSSVSNYVNGVTTVFAYENDINVAGPLAPGASYTNSAQFTLPPTVAGITVAGRWYVVPVVDIHFAAGGTGFGTGTIGHDELAAPLDVSTPPPADLQVTSVSAPTNAVAGQPINVGWKVANNGNNQTSSGYWYDAVYLSTNSACNPSQSTPIGTFGHFGVLDLTSNYTQSISVTVPATLFPTNILVATYYLFVVADAGNAVAELNKTNNVLGAVNPLVVQQAPPTLLADLAVTAVGAPWTTIAGSQVNISWAVTNQGPGSTSAGAWVDSVYLSPNAKLNVPSAWLLGNVPHNGILPPGGSYSQSQVFNLPYCAIGSNYVFVLADSGAQVNEGGALANNLRAADQAMHIWPGNAARLEVSAVNPPANAPAGSPLTVSWTVGNPGGATTNAPWVDALYLSSTPQLILSNSYLLGLYTNVASLASGGSYTRTLSPLVPRCFSGAYYAAVVADIGNVVNAISCDTNNSRVSSVPVQVTPSGYASLQVAGIALPAAVNSGYPWNVQWTVTNAGPTGVFGTWFDAIYASLSPTLDNSALLLGQFSHTSLLPSGAIYTQTQSVAFPACWSGTYYIYGVADVSNSVNSTACVVNNQARSPSPLTVNVGAHPDLAVSSVGIPGTAYAGQSMPVSWTVTNAGSATANGPWLDSVYLSISGTFSSGSSLFLGSYPYNGSLAAGATYNQTTAFTLPNTTHGNFYVYVMTDSTNAVNECQGETNNVTGSSSVLNVPVTLYPDLKVTAVQVPASAYSGQTINISWVVTNEGTDSTPGSIGWNDAVFLSDGEVLDPSDTRLGNFGRPSSLGIGQSYTNSATVQIPPSAAGPYYILVLADSGGSLFEYLGYNDSLGWNPSAMIVSLPPVADLAATNVTLAPSVGVPGSTVTIGWTVLNVSSNNIPSTWTDAVYLSTNNFWNISAMEVASQNHSGLAANAGYSASWTGPLPALTPGSYHAIVRADVRNTVRETNLVNNTAVSANTIAVDVSVLVLGQPVTNQLTTGSAQYYKVNVPAGQTVRLTLTGASTNSANELFVRYGAVPDLGNYDFLYNNPLSPNQQISIPTTQAGWYYIMVRGGNEPGGPLAFTLEASIIPFAISGVSQNHIGDNGQVTITLTGAQFQAGATVELVSGTTTYFSQTNFFNDATSIATRFVFSNAVQGLYNVVLTNPNNQSTTATQALTIETALPLTAQVVPGLLNNFPRVGLPFEWNGAVVNAGNVDISYHTLGVALSQPWPITLTPPAGSVAANTNSTDNPEGACFFMVRDLAPGASADFSFVVSSFGASTFSYYVITTNQSKQDFLLSVTERAETLRDFIMTNSSALALTTTNLSGVITTNAWSVPPQLAGMLADATNWENLYAQILVTEGALDSNDLASLPSPPIPASRLLQGTEVSLSDPACASCATTKALDTLRNVIEEVGNLANCLVLSIPCLEEGPYTYIICVGLCELVKHVKSIKEFIEDLLLHLLMDLCDWLCTHPTFPCSGGIVPITVNGIPTFYIGGVCPPSPGDPNALQGPPGYSTSAFVGSQVPWQYTIYFENESNALAFARQIVITNVLNPNFDIRTFRVSEIAFGDVTIKVPANRSFYQTRVAAPSQNPTNVVVDVTVGVDVQHNTVFWTLNAIDLNTGQLVASAFEGVLPPDSPDPIGQGHVTFTIQPAAGVPTGTVITNEASIVFDNNDPINTNPTTNTVDAVPPTSTVLTLPSAVLTTNFTVSWFGTDDPSGSGVGSYDIYVSDNGGPWQPWQTANAATSATYSGQPGHSYYFYSVAHDNSGNVEHVPSGYEAMTFVSTNQPPTLPPIVDQTLIVGNSLVLTNVASGSQELTFSLQNAPAGAYINPTSGNFSWTPGCAQGSTTNLITIWATDNGLPPLSNSVTFAVVVGECVQVSIGSTVMQIGTTSSVPVNLLSTVAVTNLSFTLSYPTNRFNNWTLTTTNTAIGGVSVESGPTNASFTLGTKSGQVLQGPAQVGMSGFGAMSNSSAFVPLAIGNIQGTKSDGSPVGNTIGLGGRVVVIGKEPLLEAALSTNAQRLLTLYGNPGSSYLVSDKTNLLGTNWLVGWRVPMTNLAETFGLDAAHPMIFYRAAEFFADPPILELNSSAPTNLVLLMYGQKGSNYAIVTGTNLAAPGNWSSMAGFTLTNSSFQFIGAGAATNQRKFFRAERQ